MPKKTHHPPVITIAGGMFTIPSNGSVLATLLGDTGGGILEELFMSFGKNTCWNLDCWDLGNIGNMCHGQDLLYRNPFYPF